MFQIIRLKAETSLNGPNLVFHVNNKQIMARSKYEIWLKVYFHLYATNKPLADKVFDKVYTDDKVSADKVYTDDKVFNDDKVNNSVEEYVDRTLTEILINI